MIQSHSEKEKECLDLLKQDEATLHSMRCLDSHKIKRGDFVISKRNKITKEKHA